MTHEDIAQLCIFLAIVLVVGIAVNEICRIIDERW